MNQVTIYTDGACQGNPGPGGYAAVLEYQGTQKTISGYHEHTTNNQMELMAAIEGLRALNKPCEVNLVTDSIYVKNGITNWIHGWIKKNWRTAGGSAVKNKELWIQLIEVADMHTINWQWVKGHSGHPGNELADQLARKAIEKKGIGV